MASKTSLKYSADVDHAIMWLRRRLHSGKHIQVTFTDAGVLVKGDSFGRKEMDPLWFAEGVL
ncbi:hypothetical protein M404DRAFT_1007419 [Pisolithus tinctorius Marx 270]|uniref:Uncharacterized protein n=1 Tax=Pisolithus tinctorius Marx 270 TaxID=870435 RepID=A0A0C3N3D2_PISTI|nr:hypothetical protein M404DRAFT_1007419 [Pisolithus tinctorius Marx 270]